MSEEVKPSIRSILETFNIHSGERRQVAEFDQLIEAPNWTADGERLIFNSQGKMHAIDISSGTISPIPTGFAVRCNNDHILSPDNLQLGISHHCKEDGSSRIYVVPTSGGDPVLITAVGPSYLHGWSPDGQTLVYCAERHGQYDIYAIPARGGEERALTDTPGLDDGPEYSPDGKYIWFNSVRTGLMQIWRMQSDGSQPTQMTFAEANHWFPHVSPNGAWVVFLSFRVDEVQPHQHPANKHVTLHLLPAQGGESRPLLDLFGGQGTINVHSWAPGSERFAFVRYEV